MEKIFGLWCALRDRPTDRDALEAFFCAIEPHLHRWARRFPEPEEVVSRANCRILARWTGCQAGTPVQLAAWLRQIVRNCGRDRCADELLEGGDVAEIAARDPDPEESRSHRERGEILERMIAGALELELATLPVRHQSWGRAHKVARTPKGLQRDVQILIALRLDEIPAEEVAQQFGISRATVWQAAVRGEAALVLWLRVSGWLP